MRAPGVPPESLFLMASLNSGFFLMFLDVLDVVVFATAVHVELTLVGFHSGYYLLLLISVLLDPKNSTPPDLPTYIGSWIHNSAHSRQEASCVPDLSGSNFSSR